MIVFSTALQFLIAALVTWRMGSLLGHERLPFALGPRFRRLFGIVPEDDGSPAFEDDATLILMPLNHLQKLRHEVARMLVCTWCCSLWVALVVALFIPWIVNYPFTVLALSASAILIQHRV